MSGKLIVFEGTDGSGKSTQFKALCQRLDEPIPLRPKHLQLCASV